MDLFYLAASVYDFLLGLWCCTAWRARARQRRFLIPAIYVNMLSLILCFGLRPHLGPVAYGWLYVALAVAVDLSLVLVLFGLWSEIRPRAWVSAVSAATVLVPILLVSSGTWVFTAMMLVPVALGMALCMSCALGSRSGRRTSGAGYARQFAVTGLALYFGVRFASFSGLIASLSFRNAANFLVALGSVMGWTLIAWGLRHAPATSPTRRFEHRKADAARGLWRSLP